MQHRRQVQSVNDDEDNVLLARPSQLEDRTTGGSMMNREDNDDDDDDSRKRRKLLQQSQSVQRRMMIYGTSVLLTVILLMLVYIAVQTKYMTILSWLRLLILFPIYLCVYTCLHHMYMMKTTNSPPPPPSPHPSLLLQQQRIKKILMPLTLIVTVLSAQLPPYIGAAIASTCIILFSIVTRPALETMNTNVGVGIVVTSNAPLIKSKVTFATVVISMITMIVVLLVENFLIWVVSATFVPGYSVTTAPPPLQDNGQLVLNYVFHTLFQLESKAKIISLRRLLNTQWSLVACVGTSFVVTEVYDRRRTLYGIANRALMTVAVARFIRTISFIMTVVPSQNRNCYIQRGFPFPPPDHWIDWIWIGIIPRSHGGCNDLIISGHATIISTLACISTSISNDSMFAIALWSMVVMDFMIEIYEGFHYSVDMWLGIVLVTLLWNVLQSFEGLPPASLVSVSDETASSRSQQQQQESLSTRGYVAYILPGLVAYLQLIVISQDIANIVIVLYVSAAVLVYVKFASKRGTTSYLRKWYIHYAQHILLCLVFMALGIYL